MSTSTLTCNARKARPSLCYWSPSSYIGNHPWRNQFGGMKADDVKRLKELEAENARLKRIVADQALNIAALNEVSKGNW